MRPSENVPVQKTAEVRQGKAVKMWMEMKDVFLVFIKYYLLYRR